ncbi:DUF2332 domain-containing protein [Paractinoplanes ferrugineus]|nr:DUF2332 domain-containing protein [Actinoplanes ferrugineus]
MSTARSYAEFAAREAHRSSPAYAELSVAVARDPGVLTLLDSLPPAKRQPNLLYAVVTYLGGPVTSAPPFLDFVRSNWPRIEPEMRTRATQTNEVGRCALLLPVLAALPQPLALLEIGASAGLNLYPDRYAYRYGSFDLGESTVVLDCELTGAPPPTTLPRVGWRAGLDLNPLDITDPDDARWLESLIWPEHHHRRDRLRAAARIAASAPPALHRGDLAEDLPALAAQAPADATLVVFHTSVLYQVPSDRLSAFSDCVRDLPGHWISVEGPATVAFDGLPDPPDETLFNVLALDGRPLAWAHPHGQGLHWFA